MEIGQERANNLRGSLAEILVGAPTKVERAEMQHRIEDAISATRAGLEEGVVPGGGTALARASAQLRIPDGLPRDELVGWQVVRDALRACMAPPPPASTGLSGLLERLSR